MEFIAETPRRRGTPETAGISGNGYSITEYGRFERVGSRATRGLSPRKQGAGDDWDHFWSTLRQPKSTSALSARQPGVDATAAGIRHTCCVLFSSRSRRLGDEKEARPSNEVSPI